MTPIVSTPTPDHLATQPPARMRAIVQHRYGSADVLELATIEPPTPGKNEVLIEVVAAGLDRGVEHLITGQPYLIRILGFGFRRPKQPVPGLDVAGRVIAVGAAVERFAPGDDVFGIAKGSFAEYAVASQHKLSHKAAHIPFDQAATAAISGITALQALTKVADLQRGQRVLVIGASGGVGSFAVQIAKALGAEVTGVCSTGKVNLVRELGATRVIDYTTDDYLGADRFDLIVDIGGGNSVKQLRRSLTRTGTLVIVGAEHGGRWTGGIGRQIRAMLLSPFVRQRLTTFVSQEHHTFIDQLATYLVSGAVIPAIGQRFSLEQTADALRQLGAGEASGKSVIIVRDVQI